MLSRPVMEKLGFIPRPEVVRIMSVDHRGDAAAMLVLKTLLYFGSLSEHPVNNVESAPDFLGMYNALITALKLDPYNMDAYYFAQSFLPWDVNRVKEANAMIDYGMRYRKWDWYLPFFGGFNSAFFLKDYAKAAEYFKRVGELTGSELSVNLTGRFLYESGKTDMAIAYLNMMEKGATNDAVKLSFSMRLDAFKKVRFIESASEKFQKELNRRPSSLEDLKKSGYLNEIPVDPYGGKFFLTPAGQVRSTSDFASGWLTRKNNKTTGANQ
jgi:tetratricopeptide (TPR) repeat protein